MHYRTEFCPNIKQILKVIRMALDQPYEITCQTKIFTPMTLTRPSFYTFYTWFWRKISKSAKTEGNSVNRKRKPIPIALEHVYCTYGKYCNRLQRTQFHYYYWVGCDAVRFIARSTDFATGKMETFSHSYGVREKRNFNTYIKMECVKFNRGKNRHAHRTNTQHWMPEAIKKKSDVSVHIMSTSSIQTFSKQKKKEEKHWRVYTHNRTCILYGQAMIRCLSLKIESFNNST